MSRYSTLTIGSHGAARTGGGGSLRNIVGEVLEALAGAREARDEYQRRVARGAEPAVAVRAAFDALQK